MRSSVMLAKPLIVGGSPALLLNFFGWIPSKKNKLRPRQQTKTDQGIRGRGFAYDRPLREALAALETQARIQWGPRAPWKHPFLDVKFRASIETQDLDGMYTALVDALKKARVIEDDSIKVFNGGFRIRPAEIVDIDHRGADVLVVQNPTAGSKTLRCLGCGEPTVGELVRCETLGCRGLIVPEDSNLFRGSNFYTGYGGFYGS